MIDSYEEMLVQRLKDLLERRQELIAAMFSILENMHKESDLIKQLIRDQQNETK